MNGWLPIEWPNDLFDVLAIMNMNVLCWWLSKLNVDVTDGWLNIAYEIGNFDIKW